MTVYKFRQGSRFSGDAGPVVDELERIRSEEGALRPESVLAAAEDEASALHPHFEWDDSAAAREYRLETARRLIRAVVTPAAAKGDEPLAKYVYTDREYVPIATIAADPGRYMQALSAAQRDLDAAHRRVNDLLAAAKVAKSPKGDVARIMLAVEALKTANDAIQALH